MIRNIRVTGEEGVALVRDEAKSMSRYPLPLLVTHQQRATVS